MEIEEDAAFFESLHDADARNFTQDHKYSA